jgi:hypothetical protein
MSNTYFVTIKEKHGEIRELFIFLNCINLRENMEEKIKIIRSPRRKKTVSAKLVDNELIVYLPDGMPENEEKKWIAKMVEHLERRKRRRELDNGYLKKRARALNHKYFDGKLKIKSIEYVTNQTSRFGSCTTNKGTIRISDRLAEMPRWVLDYVIVHELAHLVHANHSKAFWRAVNKYRYAERARGYLMAKGMED